MEEVWKDVPGYEGYYQVSNIGRVRSLDRIIRHKLGKGERIVNGKILSPTKCRNGYLNVHLAKDGRVFGKGVHRLVAMAFLPNPLNLPQANHVDENKLNNHVSNIEWCTALYNNTHGTRTARASKTRLGMQNTCGERTGTSKLKEAQVLEIFNSKKSNADIRREFKIGTTTIYRIRNKENWKHILTNL